MTAGIDSSVTIAHGYSSLSSSPCGSHAWRHCPLVRVRAGPYDDMKPRRAPRRGRERGSSRSHFGGRQNASWSREAFNADGARSLCPLPNISCPPSARKRGHEALIRAPPRGAVVTLHSPLVAFTTVLAIDSPRPAPPGTML